MIDLPTVFFLLVWIGGCRGYYWPVVPTNGRPWPQPQKQLHNNGSFVIDASLFRFQSTMFDCDILDKAYGRYMDIIFPSRNSASNKFPSDENSTWITLDVGVMTECEVLPHPSMDETYHLSICDSGHTTQASLSSASVWGALRGLETFSQLIIQTGDPTVFEVECTEIVDFPRFPHRGLMLDTSRHFLPVETIKENLDLMAMNKFNVFHWHIVDDQSFPYSSAIYPNLSSRGAWSPHHVYTGDQIADIVEHARIRGIRVLAEFDTPGHTRSWGEGQPGLLAECYRDGLPAKFGPIDPSKEENYIFLKKLFSEIAATFPDPHIHLGGDEVDFECWRKNSGIQKFMFDHNMTGDYLMLLNYYFSTLQDIVGSIDTNKGHHVWQEVFDNFIKLHWNTIVHVWKFPGNSFMYFQEMSKVTKAGYRVVLSACWYLNYIQYGIDWHKYYNCDPHDFYGTPLQYQLVIGGEACLWAEFLDETNIIPTTWPRACAVAEKLWSAQDMTRNATEAGPRLEEHRCRLFSRGHAVQPIGPSFCERKP